MHVSIPVANTVQFIEATQVSPLISKCTVKVCYVGQQPNRNNTVITREVAEDMGKQLPGSPIVGYFNRDIKDFEGHERKLILDSDKLEVVDKTKPYGFVPTNAKVWFQKFTDDGVEHEYLVTECYLWTSAYPECKRVITQGNNQSMELDKEKQAGFWSNDNNSDGRFFIYSEALVEKLCILGEHVEPCFEGAQFITFSLDTDSFKTDMYSMMTELQKTLEEGGFQQPMENNDNKNLNSETEFEKKSPEEGKEKETKQEPQKEEDKKKKNPTEDHQAKPNEEDEKKKCGYNLEEVVEYQDLMAKYTQLQGQFSTLQQEKATLDTEIISLRQFKLTAERQTKQAMIDSFYMLTDEDKKDVIEHMDTYSVDDIEAKLSIICVRNKVDFNLNNNNNNPQEQQLQQGLFNLNEAVNNDTAPAWIKAIRDNAKKS